ncbi:MAG: hypothetical protein WBL45_02990 [Solirubrobacterales bacterium]
MQTMVRESWTDERLDDLNDRVDAGFTQMDEEFRQSGKRLDRVELKLEQIDERFDDVDKRLGRLEDGFFALNKTLIGGFVAVFLGYVLTNL